MKKEERMNNKLFENFQEKFQVISKNNNIISKENIKMPICIKKEFSDSINYIYIDEDGDHIMVSENEKGVNFHFGNYFSKFESKEDVKEFSSRLTKNSEILTIEEFERFIDDIVVKKYGEFKLKKTKYGRRINE